MISHHIYLSVALAHKESQMEAARQAHQARSLRPLARISRPRRSFLSRIAGRGSGHLPALEHSRQARCTKRGTAYDRRIGSHR